MATESNFAIEMYGNYSPKDIRLISGVIESEMNEVPVARIEFISKDHLLDLGGFLGKDMGFSIRGKDGKEQLFYGTCVSIENKGSPSGDGHYFAEVRPWLWFLTRSENNRIFQDKKTTTIVQDVLKEYGFSGDLKTKHSKKEPRREYCVQYRETDLNFIKRLLEEDGIYFFFEFEKGTVKMVLADKPATHDPVPVDDKLPYRLPFDAAVQLDHIFAWESAEHVVSGKVTLDDYNFTKPNADLTSLSAIKIGEHQHNTYEIYRYHGRFEETSPGKDLASHRMEAAVAQHQRWKGQGNIVNMSVGCLFDLIDHPRHTKSDLKSFMITRMQQYFRLEATKVGETPKSMMEAEWDFELLEHDNTRVLFEAVLKSKPFRMPAVSPWPEISGVQTAVVTGPNGAEIETDKYGRIKVQFHWDRKGEKNENSSCWVRTMMPMAGSGWGAIAVPRVGHEVVIQFEEGNPDRPLCVGVLYNADLMPPYELPANATRSGIKSNSSKGGGGYNELMFEDKKGDELVRFAAEKDFVQTVGNSAHVRVGYAAGKDVKKAEAQAEGSMKLEVENHLDEIVEKGDHAFEVKAGKQTLKIMKDKTETVKGKFTQKVTGDVTREVKMGNVSHTVKMGNEDTVIKMGNYSIKTSLGAIEMTAMQSITLKVGTSSIKVDNVGVTIKGLIVKVEGTAMTEIKAPITQVKGDGTLILKGGITMIN